MGKQPIEGESIYLTPTIIADWNKKSNKPEIRNIENGETFDLNNTKDKISLYKSEVIGWFLDPAAKLLERSGMENNLLVLMVCMSYFEGIQQCRNGESSHKGSKKIFQQAVGRIFPKLSTTNKNKLADLYSHARCGLFHNLMTGDKVYFYQNFPEAIQFKGDTIEISPHKLLDSLRNDFETYVGELNSANESGSKSELLENFLKFYRPS